MNSFGSRLKEERNILNLSIEDVSEKTKIRPHLIKKMEEGDFSFLPPVYISSFIKTYSELLNIPKKDIDEQIASLSKPLAKSNESDKSINSKKIAFSDEVPEQKSAEKPFQKQPQHNKYKQSGIISYLIYFALGLTIIALMYIAFFSTENGSNSDFPSQSDIQNIGPDTTVIRSDKGLKDFYAKPDSILLEAIASDTAWMSITIDGKINEQIYMYPDMKRSWSAYEYFILSIGNEGAVKFIRNGETLKPFGKKGSVVRNVKITETDVESSSNPWHGTTRKKPETKKDRPRPPILEASEAQPSVKPFKKEEEKETESKEPKENNNPD